MSASDIVARAPQALAGIRVLELAEMVSGPMCGKLFADMGADVVKVEPPQGDPARHHPPFPGDVPHPERSGLFLYLNTAKKSVRLDLERLGDREIVRDLAYGADVLVENHPPGRLEALGLGYDSLRRRNPGLVYVSVTPFGQRGPYRDWKGTDLTVWAMSLTGYNTPTMVDDPEKENPLRAPGRMAEMLGATSAAAAAMAALRHRDATGEGQWLDVPCWQSVVNTAKVEMAVYGYRGIPFSRIRARSAAGLEPLRCRDGYVYTLWTADDHFRILRDLLGRPEEIASELFEDVEFRMQNDDVVRMVIRQKLLEHDVETLVSEGQKRGLPIGPVYTVAQAAEHPHLAARRAFVEIDHPVAGRFRYPRALVQLSETPAIPARAPLLGEHDDEIRSGIWVDRGEPPPRAAARRPSAGAGLPLEGIRVTDFSWIINGPQIGLWLASLGAELIKIESRVYLDQMRVLPAAMADGVSGPNRSGIYHNLNYGKKSINLNLATGRGRELAYDLVRRSDFVLECYATPHTRKLGLTYEELRRVKEDIVVISVSLLGKTGLGPAEWVGWGPMAASFVGMFDAQGYPGGPPRQTGGTWPDYAIAPAVVFAALAALRHRDRTGRGQWIDASMGETVIGMMPEWFMDWFMSGRDRGRRGNRDDFMSPHNTYRSAGDDKWIAIAVASDAEWRALSRVMGRPAWAESERFATAEGRRRNHEELDCRIGEFTRTRGHVELAAELQRAGVAAGPVLDSVEIYDDPHLREWGFWWELDHHEAGRRWLPSLPVRMSGVPRFNHAPPPDLGEHNREIFGGLLGLSDEEIRRLAAERVIY